MHIHMDMHTHMHCKQAAEEKGARKGKRKRTRAGEFEGDQEQLDFAEVLRDCLPPRSGQLHGEQFQYHHKAMRALEPPSEIFFTDEASCALDALNMGVGEEILTRDSFQLATGSPSPSMGISHMGCPSGECRDIPATASSSPPPIKLDDARAQALLKSEGIALDLVGGKRKLLASPPSSPLVARPGSEEVVRMTLRPGQDVGK